jgi:hypothetical protein
VSSENMTPEEVAAVEKLATELEHEAPSEPQKEPEATPAPELETVPAAPEPATPEAAPEATEAETAAEPVVKPAPTGDLLIQHPDGRFEVLVNPDVSLTHPEEETPAETVKPEATPSE